MTLELISASIHAHPAQPACTYTDACTADAKMGTFSPQGKQNVQARRAQVRNDRSPQRHSCIQMLEHSQATGMWVTVRVQKAASPQAGGRQRGLTEGETGLRSMGSPESSMPTAGFHGGTLASLEFCNMGPTMPRHGLIRKGRVTIREEGISLVVGTTSGRFLLSVSSVAAVC